MKDMSVAGMRIALHLIAMFAADKAHGTGFYNSPEWSRHYEALRELVEKEVNHGK